ncbi:MAG: MarR family transcriptional regulator [Lachnospiraceae bacterium]|nr:MarR family transcriptional regulator [Lachnospiraceae bacterium]
MYYSDDIEPRIRLISEILELKSASTRKFTQYMNASRGYNTEDFIYMREAHFMLAVKPDDGATMSEIAEALAVSHGAVSQIAARLEKKGYITRSKNPSNRREIIVTLTDKGKAFYWDHLKYDRNEYAKLDQDYLSQFTDEELGMIRDYESLMCKWFAGESFRSQNREEQTGKLS